MEVSTATYMDMNVTSTNASGPVMNGSSALNTFREAVSYLLIVAIGIAMVGVGCGVEWRKLLGHLKKPTGIVVGFISQFLIMPALAFAFAKIFQMNDLQTIALLIVGSCPGGTSSNVVTVWIGGDIDLSIAMTFMSSTLGFGMMPLLLFLYSLGFGNSFEVPFQTIGITLASLMIPVLIGMFIRHKFPNKAKLILKILSAFGIVAVIIVAVVSVVLYRDFFVLVAGQLICAALFPGFGMLFGYGFSSLISLIPRLRLGHRQRRTIAIETGIQNTQLATGIIQLSSYTAREKGSILLFPVVFLGFQLVWTAIGIIAYRIYLRKKGITGFAEEDSSSESCNKRNQIKSESDELGNSNAAFEAIEPPKYDYVINKKGKDVTKL